MNKYPLWKYLLILFILVVGAIYAAPNLYKADPAVQISAQQSGLEIDESVMAQVEAKLTEQNISFFGVESDGTAGMVRFATREDQEKAREIIQHELGLEEYIAALNMAPNTPAWLESLGAKPMSKGLDLAGGVHFLLEVNTAELLSAELESVTQGVRRGIPRARLYDVTARKTNFGVEITAPDEEKRDGAIALLQEEAPNMDFDVLEEEGQFVIQARLKESFILEKERYAVKQNLTTLRNRVNEIGVSEPLVQTQGRNRIVVQLPGIQDTARAKKILGKTANLEFRLEANDKTLNSQKQLFAYRNKEKQDALGGADLVKTSFLTGEHVTNAQASVDPETNQPQVNITLDSVGGKKMHEETWTEVGRRMGIVLVEYDNKVEEILDDKGEVVERKVFQIAKPRIISLATIQNALGKSFRITGLEQGEAGELSLLIRAGALAAPMSFVEERTIGPSLGAENIALGVLSVKLGVALVLIFMLVYYRVFGLFANIALAVNLVVLIALMSMLGATLTLPGIAGIVLTVGMAVDANVLIFSRIKEELKAGMSPQRAINDGYDNAYSTIMDANLTTLIVAVILFAIGSGPVKGFAVTLAFGICTSMFTAIMGTRALANLIFGGRKVEKLWI